VVAAAGTATGVEELVDGAALASDALGCEVVALPTDSSVPAELFEGPQAVMPTPRITTDTAAIALDFNPDIG